MPAPLVTAAPETVQTVTRNSSPVKRSKQSTSDKPKRARTPSQKRAKKPASVTGYFWRKEGAGWDLRKSVYVTGNNGERKRKQPYVAHMSQEAFRELKRKHKGAALDRAIAAWIAEHDQ
jgi:hypothetical protein